MRLDNWQNNLTALIESRRQLPFDFPTNNCLLWAADIIKAVTGNDVSLDYRGKFKSEMQAAKMLRKIDKVITGQQFLELKLRQEIRPIGLARMGDIVLANEPTKGLELPGDMATFGAVPGLCYGPISFFIGEHGLIETETLRLGGTLWVS